VQRSTNRRDDYCVTYGHGLCMLNIMLNTHCRTMVSVLSVLVWNVIPECIVLGRMSGWHYPPNRVPAYEPVAEISVPVQNQWFFCSQVIYNYELVIVHNCLDMTVTALMHHCKSINNSFCFCKSLLLGCKCVRFK